LFPAAVTKVSVPDCEPIALGLNVTLAVQLAPAARLAGQVFEAAKGLPTLTDVTLSAVLPVLVNCTVCAAEVVETLWFPKASEDTLVLADV
jgi:hypothetical protein